jgi:hypothetical protein
MNDDITPQVSKEDLEHLRTRSTSDLQALLENGRLTLEEHHAVEFELVGRPDYDEI